MAKAYKGPARVWIELDHPKDAKEGQKLAALLSRMLRRLGSIYPTPVFWNARNGCYSFTTDMGGSYVDAGDDGHWFNLEYLAQEAT